MHYAAYNTYATETSQGFTNTWVVYAFDDKKSRDNWVADHERLKAARMIYKTEIGKYLGAVKPFSGEAYCLNFRFLDDPENEIPGFIGRITIDSPYKTEGAVFRRRKGRLPS